MELPKLIGLPLAGRRLLTKAREELQVRMGNSSNLGLMMGASHA